MTRPYLQRRIAELEAIFETSRCDHDVLQALLHELNFRSVERSTRLKARVIQALDTLEEASPTGPDRRIPQGPSEPDILLPYPPVRRYAKRTTVNYMNRPSDILSSWTALEVLSPLTFLKPSDLVEGDERRIARFSAERPLPWSGAGEKSRPNTQLFYHVVLGAIRMEEATRALLSTFIDENADRRPQRGFAGIATITVDRTGRPVSENAVAVSSFAWGLPLALRRDLTGLGKWQEVELRLAEFVVSLLQAKTDKKGLAPLELNTLDRAFEALVDRLGMDRNFVDAPGFALRHYQWWKASEPPDPPILGSFYLADLALARSVVAHGQHQNIARYLGLERPSERIDLIHHQAALANAVSPARAPLGRWPSPGRHPLVLLQQAAVNLALSGDAATELFPVNGPPGTGKTTLLRDLVAGLVVKRAEAMCKFDDPEKAFTHTGEKRRAGSGFTHIYRPDERICGFEMLVASSNNKAVENVSRELPALNAVAADAPGVRYFKTVSDNVAGEIETWGLIAAVLGNSSNRHAFRQAAWGDEDRGLRAYLCEASGLPQFVEVRDDVSGAVIGQRKPEVVTRECPPTSREAALKQWRAARKAFRKALGEASELRSRIEDARHAQEAIAALREQLGRKSHALEFAGAEVESAEQRARNCAAREAAAKRLVENLLQQLSEHEWTRPGVLARMFRTNSYLEWDNRKEKLNQSYTSAKRTLDAEALEAKTALAKFAAARNVLADAAAACETAQTNLRDSEAKANFVRARCGSRVVDLDFFKRPHEDVQQMPPWFDEQAQLLRDRVFEAAMQVHRAFIGAAAKPVRNNMDALFKTFFGRSAWSPKMRLVMPSLWSTMFMVSPIVSTTFASIERMIGFLPPGALGWLLIDEAGQALPQAAVGAIMRCKRAVVVGDPLQIEPVTSLPTELAETICDQFRVDPDCWNAPKASVQTVADAASVFGSNFLRDGRSIWVGAPLLVHRRCADPMFSLSNRIAYADLMVKATPTRASLIRNVLGASRWIDVPPARTEDKWSAAEGDMVVELIRRLEGAGTPDLDLYVVTPFRICALRLRELLAANGLLLPWTDRPREWVRDRVGTVHTVQGREADTVIFVLGAPLPGQHGARAWAGAPVNLLNVAATRAKENLYVIGSRSAWAEVGCFRDLANALPSSGETIGSGQGLAPRPPLI